MNKKHTILVVDDERRNIALLSAMLEAAGYRVITAENGGEALAWARQGKPDTILLDIMMPGMDGIAVVRRLKTDPATKVIPVIMVTALDDRASKLRALDSGAEEYLTKPVDRPELLARVRNMLRLKEYGDFLAEYNTILENKVRERTVKLRESYQDTIHTMTRAAEYKDEETGSHVRRISYYTRELALHMGLSTRFAEAIFYSSPMHDVGKIGIPDHILLKPGPFSPQEWDTMKAHTVIGGKILGTGKSAYIKMGAQIALTHHERYDGSGYPQGLCGSAIPLSGRIAIICDQYDALRSKRPYKPAFEHETAVRIIADGDGRTMPGHFDPKVLDAFLNRADSFREIYEAHTD